MDDSIYFSRLENVNLIIQLVHVIFIKYWTCRPLCGRNISILWSKVFDKLSFDRPIRANSNTVIYLI